MGGVTGALMYKALVELLHPAQTNRELDHVEGSLECTPLNQCEKVKEECV